MAFTCGFHKNITISYYNKVLYTKMTVANIGTYKSEILNAYSSKHFCFKIVNIIPSCFNFPICTSFTLFWWPLNINNLHILMIWKDLYIMVFSGMGITFILEHKNTWPNSNTSITPQPPPPSIPPIPRSKTLHSLYTLDRASCQKYLHVNLCHARVPLPQQLYPSIIPI